MLPKGTRLHEAAKAELNVSLRIPLHTPHLLLSPILASPSDLREPKMDTEFLQIVESFKANAELTPKERDNFQFSSLNDVLSTLRSIQEKQSKTKRLVFMRRIDPFLKTMVEYGKVIEVFVNTSEILAFVWGPIKYLLQIASNYIEAFDSLLDTYQQVGEQIPLLESYKDLFSNYPHMRSLLVLIYQDIMSFHLTAFRFFRQKLWKQLFRSNWKGFSSEISLLKENLRRHKQLIEGRASLIEFETLQNLRVSAEAHFRELKETENRRRKTAVQQWLCPSNIQAIQERHVKARSSNSQSCRWILGDSRFQRWFHPLYCSTPLLWINGKPGAGKSVLTSVIVEEAMKLNSISVGFFYCADGNPERDDFLPIARSILAQLLAQDESLLLHFEHKMSTSSGHAILSSLTLAQELLQMALGIRKTYIILDGIDECGRDQRKEICRWFKSIVDSLPTSKQDEIRCLFVSQDDGIARKDLSMLPTITITADHNKVDIMEFCRHWQDRIEDRFGSLKEHGLNLTEIVTAKSQGIFIFAKCVLEELSKQPCRDDLLREWRTESFPSDLNEVYDRILRRLMGEKQTRNITKKLLSWISLSKRPLRWFEIQAGISIDLDTETINKGNRRLLDTSKDLCASFVEVHTDETVELVHSTVREFLILGGIIQASDVELELCLLSLAYLNFPDFCIRDTPQSTREALLSGRYSFYEYAVACWVPHLMSWLSTGNLDNSSIPELQETIEQFLDQHFSESCPKSTISKTMHDKLRLLHGFDNYDSLAQTVVWSRKQLLIDKCDSEEANLLDFPDITSHIRSILENMSMEALTPELKTALELYYGKRWFKCPKIYCRHFYDGFESRQNRDQHVSRHERAYTCTFDNCPTATFGCLSKKDLDKHMLEIHGISSGENDFPDVPDPNPTSMSKQKHRARFQCTLCSKRFTRAYNLRSHLRTHTNERPYVCTICGKAFPRQHDRKTHESLHSGEKRFVCRGDLEAGGTWGCTRRFSRASALGRHFRTKAGRRCIKPLLDEELAKRSLTGSTSQLYSRPSGSWNTDAMDIDVRDPAAEQSSQQTDTDLPQGSWQFPAALLAQYPALAEINWDIAPGGHNEGEDESVFPAALLAQYPALAEINWGIAPGGHNEGEDESVYEV
ncbi:unnamed protein product [Clonostachys byssicola]|uniref:C2H2-type domain-containing protein n=1 Tax=Clonostachys byssicola TaxID=160290 RepID=A0A9N9XZC6_9HYPO|nr:unnamed protein product [Clonostachys byssicola]